MQSGQDPGVGAPAVDQRAEPDMKKSVRIARWIAAVIMIAYGFAKLTGSQFTVLDSELSKPMGEVNGFWLTWYYFGSSAAYRTIVALVEIGGGLLLIWPRTALIGALALLPVVGNIIVIDILFGIVNALPAAVLAMICLITVIRPHARRIAEAVLLNFDSSRRAVALRAAVAVAVLAGAWGFTYWIANYNNRNPTPIDGVWTVEESGRPLERVFFEYNRAGMAVFRSFDGDSFHHFEVDSGGTVRVWEEWKAKGPLIYEGEIVDPERIELRQTGGASRIILVRE